MADTGVGGRVPRVCYVACTLYVNGESVVNDEVNIVCYQLGITAASLANISTHKHEQPDLELWHCRTIMSINPIPKRLA